MSADNESEDEEERKDDEEDNLSKEDVAGLPWWRTPHSANISGNLE